MLYLDRLSLKDFRKHSDLSVDFTAGLNVIAGPNWVGKTTLKYAILFALYGAKEVPGGKAGIVPRQKPEAKPKVTLGFGPYRLERTLSSATLYRDGEPIARGASEVTALVDELLELPKATFLDMRVSYQGEAAALLSMTGTELKQLVERLAGVDTIDRALQRIADRTKIVRGRLDVLRPQVEQGQREVAEATSRKTELAGELAALTEQTGVLACEIEQQEAEQKRLAAEVNTAERRHREFVRAEAKRETLSAQCESIENRLVIEEDQLQNFCNEIGGGLSWCDERIAELEAILDASARVSMKRERLRGQLESTQRALDTANTELQALVVPEDPSEVLKAAQDRHLLAGSLASNCADRRKQLLTSLEQAVCRTCLRPFDVGETEKVKAELAGVEVQLKGYDETYSAASEDLDQARRAQESYQLAVYRRLQLRNRIEDLQRDVSTYQGSLAEMGPALDPSVIEQHRANLTELRRVKGEAERLTRSCRQLTQDLAGLRKELEALEGITDVDPEPLKLRLNTMTAELGEAKLRLQRAQTDLENRRAEWNRLTKLILDQAEKKAQLDREINLEADLGRLSKLVKQNRDKFLGDVWEGLLGTASQFVTTCTAGGIERIGKGENFDLYFVEEGYAMPLVSASGAQRSIIGLGLRVAVGRLQPCQAGFILLDEVTADMSPAVSALTEAALRAAYPQVVSITHREMDQVLADNLIVLGAT
jgi:DNA repair exonuclease SbcCD ATPase subunit